VSKLAIVAFGGNALVTDAEHDSIPDQYETVCRSVSHLVDLIERGWNLVVSHGNGPQVGFILRRSELSQAEVDPIPIDYAVADTQGAIGYMFVKALTNELTRRGLARPVVAVVTQSVVDPADEAFKKPTKPIGSFLNEKTARERAKTLGWTVTEDAGRGFRRTVASPPPQRILESSTIRTLLAGGAVVVAVGGGGIAVAQQPDGSIVGVEAVIDKDLASALLARELGAQLLLIPTGV
jgi:carbamate kinase